ncbi:M48 family metallopeptidase [Scleromatobacter humisilvae]|uniref:M48 family metallopeptidase n=1 Tax=Scleromatobacter humisilvae TaxID=2897159 RepID=A0A9X1YFE7_9BURK|nr:M48 family metallopeptidase [Scleromatobacter humisilvae]MCK9684956.1 M48 family metallopeptidase [Scleromatobacter humisilvae]
MKAFRSITAILLLALSLAGGARAQAAAAPADAASASASGTMAKFHIRPVDDAWRASLPRNADAATQAYLDRLPADVVTRSNAYFEGGYWLQLWNFLLGLAISCLLLRRRISARVRDACLRIGRFGAVRDALYGVFFSVASFVLSLPLTVYQGFFREHQYGMATQTFVPWLVDQLVMLAAQTAAFALALAVLYAVIRRTGERWWIWGTVATMAMLVFVVMIGPVWIDPLTNTYKPVSDPVIKAAVLQMAHADEVPVDEVYEFDASRQTTRVSANVSGILGTASVRLNDNLLRTTLPEIRAVMGHELGHFVMNHIYKGLCEMTLLILVGFVFAKWALDAMLRRFGAAWGVRGAGDVAGFPLFIAVFSAFMFVTTPITNTLTRTQEIEADRFGLNLAREPHGEAEVDLKLTEYRKPDPGPIEEFVFFDHPSTRHRVHDAMQWREAMGTP